MTPYIQIATADDLQRLAAGLSDLLVRTVDLGASIGFLAPLADREALGFWETVRRGVMAGDRIALLAMVDGEPVGAVQLLTAMPDNGRHRCEIAKLMVTPSARGQGVAAALMARAEAEALRLNRSLIVLDTQTGSDAERLYDRLGYCRAGSIPRYALSSAGEFEATSLFFKLLGTPDG
jgi:GNAT superfamily N-acetyltransferase